MGSSALTSIFSAVDAIAVYDGRGIPAGSATCIVREVAMLRETGLPAGDLRRVEAISIDVHRLAMLIGRGGAEAEREAYALKRKLPKDCWAWVADLQIGYAAEDLECRHVLN